MPEAFIQFPFDEGNSQYDFSRSAFNAHESTIFLWPNAISTYLSIKPYAYEVQAREIMLGWTPSMAAREYESNTCLTDVYGPMV